MGSLFQKINVFRICKKKKAKIGKEDSKKDLELQEYEETRQTFGIHFDQNNVTNEFAQIREITPNQVLEDVSEENGKEVKCKTYQFSEDNQKYVISKINLGSAMENLWEIVMADDIGVLVMLPQLNQTSDMKVAYPTDDDAVLQFGKWTVKCEYSYAFNTAIIYTCLLSIQEERKLKKVVILDYKDTHDIPLEQMFQLLEQITSFLDAFPGKVLLNDSASVGNLIFLHKIFRDIKARRKDISVFETVSRLQELGLNVVEDVEEYEEMYKLSQFLVQKLTTKII